MLIIPYLDEIRKKISQSKIFLLSAPTGSGKTTALPVVLRLSGYRVFVVIPTREGVRAGYRFGLEMTEKSNLKKEDLGYAAQSEINYTKEQSLVYVTSGHMRRKLLSYMEQRKDWNFTDILIIDEAHSPILDYTIIFSFYNECLKNKEIFLPKLLLLSASPILFPFEVTIEKFVIPEERKFKLSIEYLSRDLKSEKEIYLAAVEKVLSITRRFQSGDILIFAPGKKELYFIKTKLQEKLIEEKYKILIAHSTSTKEEIDEIFGFSLVGERKRKIIISTNMFEVSVTLPNLAFVIDTLLEKRSEESTSGGIRLVTTFISKSSAQQRAGRTGRIRDGICYRLCTEKFFNKLPERTIDEIYRIPIYRELVELFSHNLDPYKILPLEAKEKIDASLDLLNKLEILQRPEKAKFVSDLNFGIRNSSFYFSWLERGDLSPFQGMIISILIDAYGPSYFFIPEELSNKIKERSDYLYKHFREYYADSEIISIFLLWNDIIVKNNYNYEKMEKNLKNYLVSKSINVKKIKEVFALIKDTRKKINIFTSNPVIDISEENINMVKEIIKDSYKDLILTRTSSNSYLDKERRVYRIKTSDRINILIYPYQMIALNISESKTRNVLIRNVNLFLEIKPEINMTKRILRKDIISEYERNKLFEKITSIFHSSLKEVEIRKIKDLVEILYLIFANEKKIGNKDIIFGSDEDVDIIMKKFYSQIEYIENLKVKKEINLADNTNSNNTNSNNSNSNNSNNSNNTNCNNTNSNNSNGDSTNSNTNNTNTNNTNTNNTNTNNTNSNNTNCNNTNSNNTNSNNTNSNNSNNSNEKKEIIIFDKENFLAKIKRINEEVTKEIKTFLNQKEEKQEKDEIRYLIDKNIAFVSVEEYNYSFEKKRFDKLLSLSKEDNFIKLFLRYKFLLTSGYFFSLPLKVFEVLAENNFVIEGFSSPFNSNFLTMKEKKQLFFCSLFRDTDEIYGSLGSFFEQEFENKRVVVNPPFSFEIINRTIDFLFDNLSRKKNVTYFVSLNYKDYFPYYTRIKNSAYLKNIDILEEGKHFYEYIAERRIPKISYFYSMIFILSNEKENFNDMFERIRKLMMI